MLNDGLAWDTLYRDLGNIAISTELEVWFG
jgi:hypothetical protein